MGGTQWSLSSASLSLWESAWLDDQTEPLSVFKQLGVLPILDQYWVVFGAWRSVLVWTLSSLMVRFGRLSSWRSWDLLPMVPENLPNPRPPSTPCEVSCPISAIWF